MERYYAIHFSVRVGAGPDWKEKVIDIGLDDLPNDMPEWEIIDMAKSEAKLELYRLGYSEHTYIYKDIHNT